jgi:hypothetical protein
MSQKRKSIQPSQPSQQKKAHMLELNKLRQKYLFDEQLSGIITGIYHGGPEQQRNLTVVPTIPFNTLQIYITFLGLVSYASLLGERFHRTNILVMFDTLFKDISIEKKCKITPADYYYAMRDDKLIEKFEEFTQNATIRNQTHITQDCKDNGRDVCSIGKYAFGTPLNQILNFCAQTFFDKKKNPKADDFCGWFMHVCEITTQYGKRWCSANNVTVEFNGTPIATNGITFVFAPIMQLKDGPPISFTKTYPERRTNSGDVLNTSLEDALVYDLCSFEEIRKVEYIDVDTHVMLIIKVLIARRVIFSTKETKEPIEFKNTRYTFNWIDDDYAGFIEHFSGNLNLNDMKIYEINSEDFSVLLHILWFISNGKTAEIDCIINFMNIMSTCIKIFKNVPDKKDECVYNINRFINDYVDQCAKYYHINFLTIMNGCRPNVDPDKKGRTGPARQVTQECMQVTEDTSKYSMCVVSCNNPPPPLPHFEEILESLIPTPPSSEPIPSSEPLFPPSEPIPSSEPLPSSEPIPPPPPAISVEKDRTNTNMGVTAVTGAGRRLLEFLKFIFIGQEQTITQFSENAITIPIPQSSYLHIVGDEHWVDADNSIFELDLVPDVSDPSLKSPGIEMTSGGKRKTHKRSKLYKRKTHKRSKLYKRKTHKQRRKSYNRKHRIYN